LREELLDKTNTASSVWADTAYRSKANEDFMEKEGFVSKVHRKKPHLKPMPRHIQKSNAGKSVIRSRVEHVFADQKSQTGLFIRTVGITRATMRIGLASIVYNMRRFLFLERLNASAESSSGRHPPIDSKRRSKATQSTVNQIAKSLKLRVSCISQLFFDHSTLENITTTNTQKLKISNQINQ